MGACPTINPDYVCGPTVELPPKPELFGVCPLPEIPEPAPIGIEIGAVSKCYLVDGQLKTFLVEVVRTDDGEGSGSSLNWHDIETGVVASVPPSGVCVPCEPLCDSTCVQLADGSFGSGTVTYVVAADGAPTVLGVFPEGAVVADVDNCC